MVDLELKEVRKINQSAKQIYHNRQVGRQSKEKLMGVLFKTQKNSAFLFTYLAFVVRLGQQTPLTGLLKILG